MRSDRLALHQRAEKAEQILEQEKEAYRQAADELEARAEKAEQRIEQLEGDRLALHQRAEAAEALARERLGLLTTEVELAARYLRERDERQERIERANDALRTYFEYWSCEHEIDGCPQDDTCACPMVLGLNLAFAALKEA